MGRRARAAVAREGSFANTHVNVCETASTPSERSRIRSRLRFRKSIGVFRAKLPSQTLAPFAPLPTPLPSGERESALRNLSMPDARERMIETNGVKLWTARQGFGVPVALLHGGPGACDYLAPIAEMIEDGTLPSEPNPFDKRSKLIKRPDVEALLRKRPGKKLLPEAA